MSYEMNAEGVNGVNSITIIQANDWPVLAGNLILQVNAGPGLGGPASWDPLIQGVAGVQSIGYGNAPGLIGQGGANQGPGVVGIGSDPNWESPQVGFPVAGVFGIGGSDGVGVIGQAGAGTADGVQGLALVPSLVSLGSAGQCRYGRVRRRRRSGWPRSSGYRRWWSEYKPMTVKLGAATLMVCKAGAAEASRVWRIRRPDE